MPVGKKKSTTPEASSSIPNPIELSATPLPQQQEFHHQLQQEACTVMRAFLQKVMREELDALIGCEWGEHSPQRVGYRNGTQRYGIKSQAPILVFSADFANFF